MQYDNYIIAAVFNGFTCFTCFRLRPHLQECLSGQFGLPALSQALCQVAACLDGQPQAPCKMSRGVCQISRNVTHMPLRTIFFFCTCHSGAKSMQRGYGSHRIPQILLVAMPCYGNFMTHESLVLLSRFATIKYINCWKIKLALRARHSPVFAAFQ